MNFVTHPGVVVVAAAAATALPSPVVVCWGMAAILTIFVPLLLPTIFNLVTLSMAGERGGA